MNTRAARKIRETSGPNVLEVGAISDLSVPQRQGDDLVGVTPANLVAQGWVDPSFGSARHGDHTLSGNETLTEDKEYDELDLAGFVLNTDGYRVRCRTLKNSTGTGRIHGDRTTTTPTNATRSLGTGSAGGAAKVGAGNGNAGSTRTNCWSGSLSAGAGLGGTGGASGAGQTGGSGGTVQAVNAALGLGWSPLMLSDAHVVGNGSLTKLEGGSGGGSGGAAASCTGGAGGAGASVCDVHAYRLDSTASTITISANGANGQDASGTGTGAGGGGGGGGGSARLVYTIADGSLPTVQALGGSGGAAFGAGSAGASGANGNAELVKLGA